MNKIDLKFRELKEKNEKTLISFIALGEPSFSETIAMAQELERAGADIIELGIPYSDPLADGPVIEAAYHNVLCRGTKLNDMLECVGAITSKIEIPVVIMVYYNVVFCRGVESFIESLSNFGVSGLIIPDVPLEEREELLRCCVQGGISLIPLVAPTSRERIKKITANSNGFIYCVSHAGTTGEQKTLNNNIKEYLEEVKISTETPICVGFGISSRETVNLVKEYCDGIIIGSAIVRRISSDKSVEDKKKDVFEFVKGIKEELK